MTRPKKEKHLTETALACLQRFICANKLPLVSAFLFGLMAHAFMLTNKIPYGDDLVAMFDKGATTVSGRYGLELMRLVLPDVSMPWIYGLMALALLSVAACVIIRLFEIKRPVFQLLVAAVFVSFPAQAATMNYMFTVVPYALALTLSISAVWYFDSGRRFHWLVSPVLIAFSCSIYQGYFSFASSFCVILMIKALVNGEKSPAETFRYGLRLLAMLLMGLAVYGAVILFFTLLLGYPLIGEVINEKQSIILRIAVAYSAYLKTLFAGYFAYVHSLPSVIFHVVLIAAAAFAIVIKLRRQRKPAAWLLTGLCLFLFPLSCYCLYMLADNSYIHSLALYSFASLYVLCVCLLDDLELLPVKDIAAICLALIMAGNVYYSNSWYLRNYLRFEEVKSLYSSVVKELISTPGFDEDTSLAIVGQAPALVYDADKNFDFDKLLTPSLDIASPDYAQLIISQYLGFDIPFASREETAALSKDARVLEMKQFPYEGSVQKIDDYIVVKFME